MARGELRIHLGAAPGVGKTYTMLEEAHRRAERGTDVVIAFVETHGRRHTAAMIGDLEVVPRKRMRYRGAEFPEMDLDAVLAKAKAYRPLAQHVLAKIRSVSPAAAVSARENAVAIGGPSPFAVLGITARELRLHLALGEHPSDEVVKKGQAGGGLGKGEALSHMLVLTDARQIDARFIELVTLAAAKATG